MTQTPESIIDGYKRTIDHDYIGILDLISDMRQLHHLKTNKELQQSVLEFARHMLAEGFVVGDIKKKAEKGFVPWENQEPNHAIRKIQKRWNDLGREPFFTEVASFDYPKGRAH